MTEAEWLACTDPHSMLSFLWGSDRKRRLLACACVRRLWDRLPDERLRDAVEVGEGYADGTVDESERKDWWNSLLRARELHSDPLHRAWFSCASDLVREQVRRNALGTPVVANPDRKAESAIIRDVFGNLFRPPSNIVCWLTANVQALAATTYEHRHLPAGTLFADRLSVLADALEEAGCTDRDILDHLRGPGPHVRGCWALDLILGNEV